MSSILVIARHALLLHARHRGKRAATLLFGVLLAFSLVRARLETADLARAMARATAMEATPPATTPLPPARLAEAAVQQGRWVYEPIVGARVLSQGVSRASLPFVHVRAGLAPAHRLDLSDGAASWTPEAGRFGSFDLRFLLLVLGPLWVLLLTYDLASGERARGTLKMVLAQGVSRRAFVAGHALAVVFVVVLVPSIATAVALAVPVTDAPTMEPWRFALHAASSGAYLVGYAAMGLLASIALRTPRASLAFVVFAWVAFTFGVPKIAVTIGDAVIPVAPRAEHEIEKREALAEARKNYLEENHPTSIAAWQAERVLVGERALDREAAIDGAYDARKRRRREVTTWLAALSPASHAGAAIDDAAGTTVERHQRFVHAADEHRRAVTRAVALVLRDGAPVVGSAAAVLPSFVFVDEAPGAVVGRCALRLALLLGLALALFAASLRAMESFDAR